MRQDYETHFITFEHIRIEIRYCPQWLASSIDGYNVAHLEIEAVDPKRSRLPMTETGYRSHFCQADNIEAHGGPVVFVEAWLAEAAQEPEWLAYKASSRQLSLF